MLLSIICFCFLALWICMKTPVFRFASQQTFIKSYQLPNREQIWQCDQQSLVENLGNVLKSSLVSLLEPSFPSCHHVSVVVCFCGCLFCLFLAWWKQLLKLWGRKVGLTRGTGWHRSRGLFLAVVVRTEFHKPWGQPRARASMSLNTYNRAHKPRGAG